ncbi:NUDIX hydrolase [Mycobacterium sp. E3198]|uniref:NUDIX hydrolase n=1 Tax=Mycobacterium sp. E3198 TaxID=1834143 RepID=UPI000801D84A|nr:exopolyphosphatase [Mycobacterium sp. E3198]
MTWAVLFMTAIGVALVVLGVWAYRTANRLDRLNVRYDLSWQALDGALARRAVVARAVAIDAYGGTPEGRRLAALADAAEGAARPARERAENELSGALAAVDPAAVPAGLIAELADAEARVVLARRFHNDAVRDTLALAERPLVRAFRLGGTAALPSYFEILERPHALAHGGAPGVPSHRTSARVVLLDETGAVLLLCGSDPANPAFGDGAAPRWWFTVGGEVGDGERRAEAAARELAEETGLRVSPADMIGPIWRRDEVFEFNGSLIDSEEFYLVHRTGRFEPSLVGRTELERSYIHGARWCDANDIAALTAAGEQVYPLQLGELLPAANRLADGARNPGLLESIR